MNKVILMGRLTRDPEIRYSQGERQMAIARYTLAVDRRVSNQTKQGEQTADFISCVAFDKVGEFAEKFMHQGMKMLITGHLQTGSYINREGQKIYTTDVIVEAQEFCEKRGEGDSCVPHPVMAAANRQAPTSEPSGVPSAPKWVKVDEVNDEGLPFN